ncbi:MAG: ABC transporter substrate-binding protein [Dissulfurimicrobium sp.]|uniref:ABC transporter substrate-binding protein n=1 Tax=Dissulfurimicrobium sp. TaxID=2022436 RepID=UPI00404A1A18
MKTEYIRRIGLTKIAIIFFLMFTLGLQGCSTNRETDKNKGQHVICRLKWLLNVSVAGEIWAKQSGIFKENGLEVELKEGGLERDAIKDLELGRADFGVASADQVLRACEKGAHIVVLAQIFQKNPLKWIYDSSKVYIKTPRDMKGLKVGITYGGNDEAIFKALMSRYGINKGEINIYMVHQDYNPFWRGEVALWPVYSNVEGIILAEKMVKNGAKPMFFDPAAFGIRFVANSLITSEKLYRERPELVKKITGAVLKGWQEALSQGHEEEVAMVIHNVDKDTSLETIKKQLTATRDLVLPQNGKKEIGWIDRAAWRETEDIMLAQGLIQHTVDLKNLLAGPPP